MLGKRARWAMLALLLKPAIVLIVLASLPRDAGPRNTFTHGAYRYQAIAEGGGRPYRDFQVEFPPLSLGLIHLVHGPTLRATAMRLSLVSLGFDVLIAALLARVWGRRAALAYLVLTAPLAFFAYFTLDLLSVLLAVWAFALLKRGWDAPAGIGLAFAVLAKVWPIALLPAILVARRWKAAAWAVGTMGVGMAAWVWWGGPDGPVQVLTFRHAQGWEIGSLVGNVVHLALSAPPRSSGGAFRVGTSPAWAGALLVMGLAAISASVWWMAWRTRGRSSIEGLACATAISVLLVFSPVLSDQFVWWMLPWAGMAISEGERDLGPPLFMLTLLTAAAVILPATFLPGSFWSFIVLRNAVLLLVTLVMLGRLHRAGSEEDASVRAGTLVDSPRTATDAESPGG